MSTYQIQYRITLPDGKVEVFDLNFDSQTIDLLNNIPEKLPEWTNLEFEQCSHCPLKPDKSPHCPLAANLVNIINHFDGLMSYQNLQLEVVTTNRTISKKTTAQDALSAMMGLVIPATGCPHTAYFKPMARFHLPLAGADETIYRATSMYLLAQYFLKKQGKVPDLDFKGLKKIYQNMQILNASIAERLRAASKTDSSVNALVLLDMFTMVLPIAIEESLEEIGYLFKPYIKSGEVI
ncbi:MAG: hypothetical protein P8048_11825 [Calditrichia bacterium]